MKFLVIGLGSMGKRRVRNLIALKETSIAGFDISSERTEETKKKYGIEVYSNFETAVSSFKPDAFIISTPPNQHMNYAHFGIDHGKHCFIEASVTDLESIKHLEQKRLNSSVIIAPSCTMSYYFAPQEIKSIITSGQIGEVLNINYQSGQYLPDWHPWEDIREFYVSNFDTGGCREIVPFELTWLNGIFGEPTPLACVKSKQTNLPVEIDDIYHCILRYPNNAILNLTVDVIARPKAIRNLVILGSEGLIEWNSNENYVRKAKTGSDEWLTIKIPSGTIESSYINPEEPYIREVGDFISAITANDQSLFPNSLNEDISVLETLYKLENMSK
ncbi:Gfo/Idh/MocA family oxidoreductase [Ignavibacteriales bacterium]